MRAVLFGLGIAALVMAHTLLTYPATPMNEAGSWWTPLLVLAGVFGGVFLGIRSERSRRPGGRIRYAQAMRTGLGIGLVSGLATGAFFHYYFGQVNPDFLPALLVQQDSLFRAENLDSLVIADRLALLEQRFSPRGQFFSNMASMLFFSLAFSVVSSFILGKGEPETEDSRSEHGNGAAADPRFTPDRRP
jgi:hypothetical protein